MGISEGLVLHNAECALELAEGCGGALHVATHRVPRYYYVHYRVHVIELLSFFGKDDVAECAEKKVAIVPVKGVADSEFCVLYVNGRVFAVYVNIGDVFLVQGEVLDRVPEADYP